MNYRISEETVNVYILVSLTFSGEGGSICIFLGIQGLGSHARASFRGGSITKCNTFYLSE